MWGARLAEVLLIGAAFLAVGFFLGVVYCGALVEARCPPSALCD